MLSDYPKWRPSQFVCQCRKKEADLVGPFTKPSCARLGDINGGRGILKNDGGDWEVYKSRAHEFPAHTSRLGHKGHARGGGSGNHHHRCGRLENQEKLETFQVSLAHPRLWMRQIDCASCGAVLVTLEQLYVSLKFV